MRGLPIYPEDIVALKQGVQIGRVGRKQGQEAGAAGRRNVTIAAAQ
jgi:hypothetical protein